MAQTDERSPDEMPAGLELDVLMAEKVLGLEVYQGKYDNDAHTWVAGPIINPPEDYVIVMGDRIQRCKDGEKSKDWSPSTDIVAAWEIDRGEWAWYFTERRDILEAQIWYRRGLRLRADELNYALAIATVEWDEVETKAEAYALVRCRAALKAMTKTKSKSEIRTVQSGSSRGNIPASSKFDLGPL